MVDRKRKESPPISREVRFKLVSESANRLAQINMYRLLEKGLAKKGSDRISIRGAIFLYLWECALPGSGGNGELSVTDLAFKMDRTVYQISPIIKELWEHRVLVLRKKGNFRYYRLSDQAKHWWKKIQGL